MYSPFQTVRILGVDFYNDSLDRDRLQSMNEAALRRAGSMSWQLYQDGLVAAAEDILAQ